MKTEGKKVEQKVILNLGIVRRWQKEIEEKDEKLSLVNEYWEN